MPGYYELNCGHDTRQKAPGIIVMPGALSAIKKPGQVPVLSF